VLHARNLRRLAQVHQAQAEVEHAVEVHHQQAQRWGHRDA